MDLLFVARSAAGYNARIAPSLGIIEIVGRYQYRCNFRPRVVIPLQGSGIGTRHRYPRTCTTTSLLLSPANFILITTCTRSPLFARSSFIAWRTTTSTAL
jgi:hypothetical protein